MVPLPSGEEIQLLKKGAGLCLRPYFLARNLVVGDRSPVQPTENKINRTLIAALPAMPRK